MKWLSKIGSVLVKGAEIVSDFLPLLMGVLPGRGAEVAKTVSDDLSKVAGIVLAVEAAGQAMTTPAPGAEKVKMATPLVAQVILQSDALVGRKIKDQDLFKAGCSQVAAGMADILNSLD